MAPKKKTLEQRARDLVGAEADVPTAEVVELVLDSGEEVPEDIAEWANAYADGNEGEDPEDEGTKDEEEAPPEEPKGSATAVEVTTPPLPVVGQMSNEEIMARLAQRRKEIADLGAVAKERGLAVPTTSKPKVADKDRLAEFFDGVGYSTGMRRWAHNRVVANEKRILPVIGLLGELWDQEKLEEMLTVMAEGYRRAKIQSSFPSEVMPEKKVADKVPVSKILPELMANWGPGEFQALRVALDPEQWDDALDNGQQDIEDEESAEEEGE